MLAHNVEGEHPASYSDLLLATQELERWAEARDPLPQKMAATSGLNMMHFQMPGNCTFATQATTIGNEEVEEDSSVKQEGGEKEPSADEEVKTSGRIGEMVQSVEYIIQFAKVVELYQKKNRNCHRCGSPNHIVWDCPKDISKSTQKVYFNTEEGMAKKGGWAPQKPAAAQQASPDKMPQA